MTKVRHLHLFVVINLSHYCKGRWSITLNVSLILVANVEQLLQLSNEYQVVEHIFNPCVKFLEDQPKTKENVMKILALSELYVLEKVRQGCNDLLKDMRLETLSETVHFQDLEREKLQHFLTQRIERLEKFLDKLYPQFMGLVAVFFWSLKSSNFENVKMKVTGPCSTHFYSLTGERKSSIDSAAGSWEISTCSDCRSMLNSVIDVFTGNGYFLPKRTPDTNLLSAMADFVKLKEG